MGLVRSLFPDWWPGKEHAEVVITELMEERAVEDIAEMHAGCDFETVMLAYPNGERRAALYCKTCRCVHSAKMPATKRPASARN